MLEFFAFLVQSLGLSKIHSSISTNVIRVCFPNFNSCDPALGKFKYYATVRIYGGSEAQVSMAQNMLGKPKYVTSRD